MDELIKDLTPNEASIIKKEFDKLSDNIKEDFSSRITDYSNSLLVSVSGSTSRLV